MNSTPLIDREETISLLRLSVCKVVFTKTDGTERTLYATLNSAYLPPRKEDGETEAKPRKPRPSNSIVAWDVENKDWRSFNLESVKSFTTHADSWASVKS
jgi:hypothetical protein